MEDGSDASSDRHGTNNDDDTEQRQVRMPLLATPESSPRTSPASSPDGSLKRRLVDSPVSRSSSPDSSTHTPKRIASGGVRFRSFEDGALAGRHLPQRASRLSLLSTALSLDLFYSDER